MVLEAEMLAVGMVGPTANLAVAEAKTPASLSYNRHHPRPPAGLGLVSFARAVLASATRPVLGLVFLQMD